MVLRDSGAVPYTKEALQALRAEGKPVFIDATAAWCLTCKLNERVLRSKYIYEEFQSRGIVLMVADWTRPNAEVTQLLSDFGHQGVPMYVYIPAGGEPRVLPQLLTRDNVEEALH